MSRPKNCINRSFDVVVLLDRNAFTSSMPWYIRDANANEMTVEPEEYSTTVDVSGCTSLLNMFIAVQTIRPLTFPNVMSLTRHDLHVVGWVHRHHLGIDPNSVSMKWIQC